MSGASCRHEHRSSRGLYKDRENGWIFGVCAGIGDLANCGAGVVRIVAAISLLLFFWPAVLVYAAAALLFREKPLTYAGRCREQEFWRRHSNHDRWIHS
jgi:phage shock protein PspC (stress-responsive transcriptional regulator)